MSDVLIVVHVLAGALWWGGHVFIEALSAGAARTRDKTVVMTTALRYGATADRLFPVAAVLVLISGVWLVFDTSWEFENLFVTIGFAAVILGLVLGFFFIKPGGEELRELVEEHGLISDEAMEKAKSLDMMNHVMTLLVTIAILAMVLKLGV